QPPVPRRTVRALPQPAGAGPGQPRLEPDERAAYVDVQLRPRSRARVRGRTREDPRPARTRRTRARDRTGRARAPAGDPERVPGVSGPTPLLGGKMRFRADPQAIRGSIAPLMTPFTAGGAVDHDSLANLVRW